MNAKLLRLVEKLGPLVAGVYFIYGILVEKWSAMPVILGYWAEEMVYWILTMLLLWWMQSRRNESMNIRRYAGTWALFCLGHSVFIAIFAGFFYLKDKPGSYLFDLLINWMIGKQSLLPPGSGGEIAMSLMLVTAGVVYTLYQRFIRTGRWKTADAETVSASSFGSVVVTQFIIVLGGAAIVYFKTTAYLAIVLIAAKVLFEMSGYVDRATLNDQ